MSLCRAAAASLGTSLTSCSSSHWSTLPARGVAQLQISHAIVLLGRLPGADWLLQAEWDGVRVQAVRASLASCLRLPQGEEEGANEREIQAGSLLLAPPFWKWHQLHSKGRESSAFVSLSFSISLSLALALVIVFNSEVRSCTVSRGSSSSSWSRPHATQLCVCVLSVLCVECAVCILCVCVVLPFNYTSWSKLFFSFSSLFSLIWHLFYTYLCFAHL